jgi:hypothetical protein
MPGIKTQKAAVNRAGIPYRKGCSGDVAAPRCWSVPNISIPKQINSAAIKQKKQRLKSALVFCSEVNPIRIFSYLPK